MASIDWNAVMKQAIGAAAASLGASWGIVAPAATHAVEMLVHTGEYIAAHASELDADEQKVLSDNQQLAMKNVLLTYKGIGVVVVEQATAAAWGVVAAAIQTAVTAL